MAVSKQRRDIITDFCYHHISREKGPVRVSELVVAYESRYKRPSVSRNLINILLRQDGRFKQVKISREHAWDLKSPQHNEKMLTWHTEKAPQMPGYMVVIDSCPGCGKRGTLRRMKKRRMVGDTYYIHHGNWKDCEKTRCRISWSNPFWDLVDWIYRVVREGWDIETEVQLQGLNICIKTWFKPFNSMFVTTITATPAKDEDCTIEPIRVEKRLYTQKQVEEWHDEIVEHVRSNGVSIRVRSYQLVMEALPSTSSHQSAG